MNLVCTLKAAAVLITSRKLTPTDLVSWWPALRAERGDWVCNATHVSCRWPAFLWVLASYETTVEKPEPSDLSFSRREPSVRLQLFPIQTNSCQMNWGSPTKHFSLLSHRGAALTPLATRAKKAFFTWGKRGSSNLTMQNCQNLGIMIMIMIIMMIIIIIPVALCRRWPVWSW